MKKIYTTILILSVIAATTTSCNKVYECECKSDGQVLTVTPIKDLGRMGAKNVCDGYQEQNNANGARQTCDLK